MTTKSSIHEYMICNQADEEIFRKQCAALEKTLVGLRKNRLLTDVDGSLIQLYDFNDAKIKVVNDCDLDCVIVTSEVELTQHFSQRAAQNEPAASRNTRKRNYKGSSTPHTLQYNKATRAYAGNLLKGKY